MEMNIYPSPLPFCFLSHYDVDLFQETFLVSQVWVADRGNKRIQVFDKDTGEWLGAWNNCFTEEGPSSVR